MPIVPNPRCGASAALVRWEVRFCATEPHPANDWAGQGSGSAIGIRGPGGICPFAGWAYPRATILLAGNGTLPNPQEVWPRDQTRGAPGAAQDQRSRGATALPAEEPGPLADGLPARLLMALATCGLGSGSAHLVRLLPHAAIAWCSAGRALSALGPPASGARLAIVPGWRCPPVERE